MKLLPRELSERLVVLKAIREGIQDCVFFLGLFAVIYGVQSIYRPAGYIVTGIGIMYVAWSMR